MITGPSRHCATGSSLHWGKAGPPAYGLKCSCSASVTESDRQVVEQAKAIALAQGTEDLVRAVLVFHGRRDLTEVVLDWQNPLLVICGDRGQLESQRKAAALAASAPQGRLYVMGQCGHLMNLERPAEFTELIAGVVRSVERGEGKRSGV